MPIKLGFKDVIFVMEDVDAASKVVQRRDGLTGGGAARVTNAVQQLTPEEKANLVGGVELTPWRLLLSSSDGDVKELVEELMGKSARLKAAAIDPENVRAAAAGLRMPKPPEPSNDRERAELEKKSAAERAVDAAQKVRAMLSNTQRGRRAHPARLLTTPPLLPRCRCTASSTSRTTGERRRSPSSEGRRRRSNGC